MIRLSLNSDKKSAPRALFLGAHCDDIEIGCGATIQYLLREYPEMHFDWIVFSSNPVRTAETEKCYELLLGATQNKSLTIKTFRNGFFPFVGSEIKEYFETIKNDFSPDVIFTHYRQDLHQDHRVISELTWNTFRNELILEYEIPKYDGGMGSPNFFCPSTSEEIENKCQYLSESYKTQSSKQWFTASTFKGLARLRGIECNAPEGYAEAFYCRKASF